MFFCFCSFFFFVFVFFLLKFIFINTYHETYCYCIRNCMLFKSESYLRIYKDSVKNVIILDTMMNYKTLSL
jgi:hypothetical protein